MKSKSYRVKICIVGCGAIGSRMAKAITTDFKKNCRLTGLYDIDIKKAERLAKELKIKSVTHSSLSKLIKQSDCVIEATNAPDIKPIVLESIKAKKSILVMSVGKLLNQKGLFELARKNHSYILLPSGAIAGLDAIKAASLSKINKITLTTRKPPQGFGINPYFQKNKIDLSKINKETMLFEGDVDSAVKHFPQNINVAATLALASQQKDKITIRIMTSPQYKTNSHEVEVTGDFGKIHSKTDNVACPDNPKTSYLAVLSGLQTLKQYCTGILIGT